MPLVPKELKGVTTRAMSEARQEGAAPATEVQRTPVRRPEGGEVQRTPEQNPGNFLYQIQCMMEEQTRRQEEQLRALKEEQARRQEEQARRQEEQARRQEEQARRQEEQLRDLKEEQARRQEEQAHRQEEQARRQEEQARRQEEQMRTMQEALHKDISKGLQQAVERVEAVEGRLDRVKGEFEGRFDRVEGELSEICRGAQSAGARLRVQNSFERLPELPAYDLHREGILLDLSCPDARLVLEKASSTRAFNHRHTWLLLHNSSTLEDSLSDSLILPDADVTCSTPDALLDVYRVKQDQPLVFTQWELDRNCSLEDMEKFWAKLPTAVVRRKNLNNVYLSSQTIVTQPQYFKGWSDLNDRQIDTFPKLTYPLMMLAAEDLNFRYNMKQVDLYGEERNGSFDGLAGRLQRRQVELGVASMFMRADRWRVLHYCSETVELRGAFMFRQPSQSSVSNVFLLPFSRGVWLATSGVFAGAAVLLTALARSLATTDPALRLLTPSETFTFTIGTVCQQGTHVNPSLASVRLVIFCTLMLSVFAFTAYSAKIVAILQTPSDAIQTIADLARSPMDMGVQETTYKKVYFAESKDPATQHLFQKKLLPLGERAYMSVVEGIARMRTGFFAFQVEESSGYDIISKTYTEREKCGLKQIQAFKLPMVAVPIRKHSGYRDLLATRLRWQRETGLMSRARRVWLAARPRCDAGGGGFVSVGIVDVLPCVQVLVIGTSVSVALLVAEHIVHALHGRKMARQK